MSEITPYLVTGALILAFLGAVTALVPRLTGRNIDGDPVVVFLAAYP